MSRTRSLYRALPAVLVLAMWVAGESTVITRLEFPLIEFARDVSCPVLVIHSRDDEIIPFDMGQEIFEAIPGNQKSFL